jgi:hypothetical protein
VSKSSPIIRATPIELWDRSRPLSGIARLLDAPRLRATGVQVRSR